MGLDISPRTKQPNATPYQSLAWLANLVPSPHDEGMGRGLGVEGRFYVLASFLMAPSPRPSPHSFLAGRGRRWALVGSIKPLAAWILRPSASAVFASAYFKRTPAVCRHQEKRAEHILPLGDPRDGFHVQRMPAEQRGDQRAGPGGFGQACEGQKQQQRIQRMQEEVREVMSAGIKTVQRAVQLMQKSR